MSARLTACDCSRDIDGGDSSNEPNTPIGESRVGGVRADACSGDDVADKCGERLLDANDVGVRGFAGSLCRRIGEYGVRAAHRILSPTVRRVTCGMAGGTGGAGPSKATAPGIEIGAETGRAWGAPSAGPIRLRMEERIELPDRIRRDTGRIRSRLRMYPECVTAVAPAGRTILPHCGLRRFLWQAQRRESTPSVRSVRRQ